MSPWLAAALLGCACLPHAQAQDEAKQDAILHSFSERIAGYVKLHDAVRSRVRRLKPTSSAEAIDRYQHQFAHHLHEARERLGQGSIFTPEIAAEFRRLIAIAMQGPEGASIRASLQHAAPVHLKSIRVNHEYPAGAPLQSTPPSLLWNLPRLAPDLEYRLAGRNLILRDIDANLVVDFIPGAIS